MARSTSHNEHDDQYEGDADTGTGVPDDRHNVPGHAIKRRHRDKPPSPAPALDPASTAAAPGRATDAHDDPSGASASHDGGSTFTRDDLIACRIPTEVLAEAIEAADHALAKHGPPTTDPVRAVAILTEEIGEATEDALKATSLDPNEHGSVQMGHILLMREELLQVAGYALLQVVNIDRGRVHPDAASSVINQVLGKDKGQGGKS